MEHLLMQLAAPFPNLFLKIYYKKIITVCSRTKKNIIVPLTKLINIDTMENVNINNNGE
jgi:hypothetical protein